MNTSIESVFDVNGKVIAIIGSTGILGSRYVKFLAHQNAIVVAGDIDSDKLKILSSEVKELGHDVFPLIVNICDESSIISFYANIIEKFGRIDVVINNAQVKPSGFYAPFEKYTKETLNAVVDGNLVGVTISCREACKIFLDQGYGVIINVASIYGVVAADQRLYDGVKNIYMPEERFSSPVSYAITKAGVIQLTKYLAAYYREQNIRVNCLTPGGVYDNHDESFNQQYSYRTLLGRMADKDEYNAAILFLSSQASSYLTGFNLVIDGGWGVI